MTWNGTRRVQTPSELPAARRRPRRRPAVLLAALAFALAALIVPASGATKTTAANTLDLAVAGWSDRYSVSRYEETSSRIAYSGSWTSRFNRDYYLDHVKSANARGAKATFTVKGTAVAWIGPKGPTRGKASVYLDGKWIKSVSTYATRFDAHAVLFVAPLSSATTHKLTIVVQGTSGHPTVAVDRFVVRGAPKSTSSGGGTSPAPAPGGTTSGAIVVTKDNVVIDGKTIVGTGTGSGIKAHGTASDPIQNLTIRNCVIKGFTIGIDIVHVNHLVIENCVIDNSRYAGIMVISGIGGRIAHNTIRKVGYYTSLSTSFQNNAYGIALTRYASSNFTADPRTSDYVVTGNTVEDVPYWHCFDTHAGQRITFSDNIARRCPRAFFITADGINSPPKSITITGNRMEQAVAVSGGTNQKAVTLVNLQTGAVTNNAVSSTYGTPYVYDYLGINSAGSSNVTISGQKTIP
jgi:Right handed beta helix region